MKVMNFIKLLNREFEPRTDLDFLAIDEHGEYHWLDIMTVRMNVDIDDKSNKNRGGVVFTMRKVE